MKSGRKYLSVGLATLLLWWSSNSTSFAGQPAEQVKETIDRIIELLQEPGANAGARKAERRRMIRQALLPRFDFAEMAQRSLGSHWKSLDGRQGEFVSAFTGFMENSYMSTLESYKGEKIIYLRERVDQHFAQVDTQIVPTKGEPFAVNYRLHLVEGDWKVYDVVIENISLVNNFRSQFNRILTAASFDELLKKLREKGSDKEI
jgi:phospholipid transport system substrate-binding protein